MYLKIIIAFMYFEIIGNMQSLALPNCGVRSENFSPRDTRIIGGKGVAIGQYPWVIALLTTSDCISFRQICGGTIISERWVVTAAHCVCPRVPYAYRILAGIKDLSQLNVPSKRIYRVSDIFIHPKYGNPKNDIALLRTLTRIDFSTSEIYINRICLPSISENPGHNVVVAGWGRRANGKNPKRMRKVRLHVIENFLCNQVFDHVPDGIDMIDENLICAAREEAGGCFGDSGGPLMKKNRSGVYTLTGIVSFGLEDCSTKSEEPPYLGPSVFTRASMYIPWMKRIMQQPEGMKPEFDKPIYGCNSVERLNCFPRSFE